MKKYEHKSETDYVYINEGKQKLLKVAKQELSMLRQCFAIQNQRQNQAILMLLLI